MHLQYSAILFEIYIYSPLMNNKIKKFSRPNFESILRWVEAHVVSLQNLKHLG